MISALLLCFALPAAAQSPEVSTDTSIVAVSTGAVRASVKAKPKPSRLMRAEIPPDAREWKPVSVKAGGDPSRAETSALLRQEKVNGKYQGTPSQAQASARLHKAGKDLWLVVRIVPRELERRRLHFEVRLRIVADFVEDAKVAAVSVVDRRPGAGAGLDSYDLHARGVDFEEDSPASGALLISALDPRPSKSAVNSGTLRRASFGGKAVGLADAAWFVKGLPSSP